MAQLPLVKTAEDIPVVLPRWKSLLDPVLATRLVTGRQIMQVALDTTPTVVYHLLDRTPIGWLLADIDAAAQVSRTVPMNSTTITLVATAPCNVNLWVY